MGKIDTKPKPNVKPIKQSAIVWQTSPQSNPGTIY